jgi:hypothetical protein
MAIDQSFLAIGIPQGTIEIPMENLARYYDWQDQYVSMLGDFSRMTIDSPQYQNINEHFNALKYIMVHETFKSQFNSHDFPSIHSQIMCTDGTFMVNGVKFALIVDPFYAIDNKYIDAELDPSFLKQNITYFIHVYLDEEEGLVYFDGIQLASIVQQALKMHDWQYVFTYNPFKGSLWDIKRVIHGLFSPYPFPF